MRLLLQNDLDPMFVLVRRRVFIKMVHIADDPSIKWHMAITLVLVESKVA